MTPRCPDCRHDQDECLCIPLSLQIKQLTAERDCWIDTANMFKEALELIAASRRPDGTYNRCREACEIIARETLEGIKQ